MSWNLVADENHWHDLLDNVIHKSWSLPLSAERGQVPLGTLSLDRRGRLNLELSQLLQLVQEQRLYFWL